MKLQNWKVAGLALSLTAVSFGGVFANKTAEEIAAEAKVKAEKEAAEKEMRNASDLVFALAQMADKDEEYVAAKSEEAALITGVAGLHDKDKVSFDPQTKKYVKDEAKGEEVSELKSKATKNTLTKGNQAFGKVVDKAKATEYYKSLKPSTKSCFSTMCEEMQTAKFWVGEKGDSYGKRLGIFGLHVALPVAGVSLVGAAAYYYKNTENPTVSGFFNWMKDGFMNMIGMTELEIEGEDGKLTKTQRGGPSGVKTGIGLGAFVTAVVAVPAIANLWQSREVKPAAQS